MTKTEQLKELRTLTQAGMKDCNEALTEANGDLQKAVDIIKTKGKNIVSGREGKIWFYVKNLLHKVQLIIIKL
jgi:translation elongation factor EF-Ts